jgi:hypothetical protein
MIMPLLYLGDLLILSTSDNDVHTMTPFRVVMGIEYNYVTIIGWGLNKR